MPRSMTGYGLGLASGDGHRITVEFRSVNNRFLDLNLKLPRVLYQYEQELRDIIRSKIERGRISVYVNEEWEADYSPDIKINSGKAKGYSKALENLRDELGIKDEIQLKHIIGFGDVFNSNHDEDYAEKLWKLTKDAANKALISLVDVSTKEGENLVTDLKERIDQIVKEKSIIDERAQTQVKEYNTRLKLRLSEIISDDRLDPNRIETEVAMAADRLDITEEITRLDSHVDLFMTTLDSGKSLGKSLNFILQEMGREANTIASKSWLVEISQAAIRVKEILEQIREQVQNLE